jgi:Flp pilus assembly protein TadD
MTDTPDANALYDQATELKRAGDVEGAVAKLDEVLAVQPAHTHAHAALGVYYQQLGRPDDAIRHAVRVTELEPNDPFSYTALSVIYMRCGRIPEAETAMERARQLNASR